MLTAGVDMGEAFVGTAKNDIFLATQAAHWSLGDSIDGGKGEDSLKIIDNTNTAFTQAELEPFASTMKSIEILDILNSNTINVDTTSIEGITDLYTISTGANTSTAAATTDIKATANGIVAGAEAIVVNGGKDVTVVSKNNQADTIDVGGTTAAAGKVSVTSTGDATGGVTLGTITVDGGTEITVNQYSGNNTVNTANTGGVITVNGNASTTTVTVNQSAFVTATATVAGYNAGAVAITDNNAATAADTIATVTLKNYDDSTIDSGALTTVNLEGTAGTLDINTVASLNPTVDTLALNLKGVVGTTLSAAAVIAGGGATDNTITVDDYKTLNINSSTTASTLTDLVVSDATTINVSGDAALTLSTLTLNATAGNENIVVTNTVGVTIGNALAADVKFTGGKGDDTIELTGGYTKAIDMGDGSDTVFYDALGTGAGAGGSLNGGAGNDTLVVSTDSAIAGLPEVSGFEVLRAIGTTTVSHNAHTFKALEIGTGATANTFTNVAAGVGLTVLATTATNTTVTLANATGTADVFDLTLESDNNITAATVNLAGVETININSVDTETGTTPTLNTNTLILTAAATAAKSINVKGDTELDFTGTAAANVTSFDASALKGAVTYTSSNDTAFEKVTIKGAAGNFVNNLTGGDANDTIIGGAGADILDGGAGFNTLTGGAGADTFKVSIQNISAGMDKITDFVGGVDEISIGTLANSLTDKRTTDFEISGSLLGAATNAFTAAVTTTAYDVVLFTYNSKVYAAVDIDGDASFIDGTDMLIDITGVTGTVAAGDFVA